MKKTILTSALALLLTYSAFAQNWDWARSINGVNNAQVSTIAIDNGNNIYIGGTKQGTVSFSHTEGSVELTGEVLNTQYLAKYASNGNLLWAIGLGGDTQGNITEIEIDEQGNILVVGSFQGTESKPFTVRGTGDHTVNLVAKGGFDLFLAKFNPQGELYWAHAYGSEKVDRMHGIASNSIGGIATVGYWRGGTLDFGNDITMTYDDTNNNGFLALHNADGTVRKAVQFGGEWVRLESGIASCIDEGYVAAANFQGDIYIPTHNVTLAVESGDVYHQVFMKFDNDGEVLWYNHIKSKETYGGNSVTCDTEGNSYFSGRFHTSVTFPSYTNNNEITLTSSGNYDSYIVKYDKFGNVLWARQWGGLSEERNNWISQRDDIISVVGYTRGSIFIDDYSGLKDTLTSGGGLEGFLVNFSADGTYLGSSQTFGVADNNALTCNVDFNGNTIVGGSYASNLTLGDLTLNHVGGTDAFLAKHINLRASVSVASISCNGENNGSITLSNIEGGTSPYNFTLGKVDGNEIDAGVFSDYTVYENLEPGIYHLHITDAEGSKTSRYYTVNEPEELIINANIQHVTGCFGSQDGEISIHISGGTGEYLSLWDTENGYGLVPSSQNQGSLAAGVYSFTVSDENGCVVTQDFEIEQPDRINFDGTTITNNTSSNSLLPNGAINLEVSHGTAPYEFEWKGPNDFASTDQNLSDLRGGTYVLHVEDVNGCTVSSSFNLSDQHLFNAMIVSTTNPKCKGGSDGFAVVDFENATGSISIVWSNGQSNATTATNLSAGVYAVTVTDDMGTPDDVSDDITITLTPILIEEPLFTLEARATIIKPSCPNDDDGAILLAVNGCSFPYEYEWTTEDGSGLQPNEKNQSNLTIGSYEYKVTDRFGCIKTSSVNLQSNYSSPSFSVDAFPSESVCEGTEVIVEVTSGYLYQFTIDDVPQAEPSYNTSFNIENPVDGMRIKVTAWNTAGCSSESEEIVLSVTQNVGTPQFIAGRETLFSGTTEIYTALAENAQSIEYSIVGGTATVDSETGEVTNIEEDFTIRATAYGYNGCGEEFTDLSVSVIKAYNVTFSVVNNNSEPLEDVTITIEDFSPITTDIQGAASTLLPNGIYNFIASSAQFDDYIDLFEVDGEDTTVDIILTIVGNTGVDAIGIAPYPNPFDSEIYLSSPESVKRVVIMNIAGQTLLDIQPNGINRINTSSIMPGLYIINITSVDGHMSIHKLIKE